MNRIILIAITTGCLALMLSACSKTQSSKEQKKENVAAEKTTEVEPEKAAPADTEANDSHEGHDHGHEGHNH